MVDTSGSSDQTEHRVCALCSTPARYKCPRCATSTCSSTCSRKHKQDTKCTGERDKVQYVPMNAYGWGTMMRDYCYLEDVGRKVSNWGKEIVRGGYTENVAAGKVAGARRSASKRKPTTGKSKRDMLRVHLERLGIDVELLPAGMERRTLNQSTFNQKTKCPLLTIEWAIYPPTSLASISSSPPPPYKILSHRNALSATLLALLQHQIFSSISRSRKQKENIPAWLPSIITPHPEAPECFVPPHCYMRTNPELPHAPNTAYYHKLEPTLDLSELLSKTSFVEFPTIHVFDPDASSFSGIVIDKSGSIVPIPEDERPTAVKRRKLNRTAGLKTVFNLIGGYGSEGSSHSEKETGNDRMAGLATLEAYPASDDAASHAGAEVEGEQSLGSDDVTGDVIQLDAAKLFDLLHQSGAAADEDVLDWGDEWDIDAEGKYLER